MLTRSRELLGRAAEIDRLRAHVAALGRRGRTVAVVGEQGIGKSRLLTELLDGLAPGDLGLAGRAAEFERDVPFAPFVGALDPYLGSLGEGRLRALSGEQRERLAAIFPALPLAGEDRRPLGERHRSHHAVRALLELIAAGRRCVVVIDDAHWADEASAEQIAHLLRRPPQAPFLLVLALRPSQAAARLVAAMDAAVREGTCDTIELRPLSRADAEPLLAGIADADAVYQAGGGNPFFLEQLAQAAAGGDCPAPQGAGADDVPAAVRGAIEAELAGLAHASRALLDAAAVAGDPFDAEIAAQVAGLDRARALKALDDLGGRGMVHRTDVPSWFAFRHPIVRRAVYRSTGDGWRLGAHARAAEALAATGASPASIAHHVERSAAVGDAAAVDLLARAGREAIALAPASAARWYAAALRLLPAGSEPGERAALLVPMATALTSSGRVAAARDALGDVLELVPADQPLLRGRAVTALAMLERLLGQAGAARGALTDALAELPDRRSAAAATLEIELASDLYFASDWLGMGEWARSATGIARDVGDPVLIAAAVALLGVAEIDVGAVVPARACAREAGTLLDGLGDRELALHPGAAHWVGWCEHHLERYPDVVRHYDRALGLARRGGHGHLIVPLLLGLTISRTWLGDVRAAVEDAEAAVDSAHLVGNTAFVAIASGLRCWTAVRAGGLHDALRRAEHVVDAATGDGGPQVLLARAWYGEALAAAGAPARGCQRILAAGGGPELPAVEPSQRPYLHGVLASAAIAAGDLTAATLAARLAQEAADELGLHGPRAWALRARGELALAGGDARTAANLLLDSAAAAGAVHPLERERSRALAGRALGAAGRRPAAVAALEQARGRLAAWSATRLADLATRELRRLGVRRDSRPRRGRGAGPLSALSAREMEVAQLVEQRLTNREIAEHLVLSPRTVEHHIEHIFDKLGVDSRVAVARAIGRARGA